jgi:aspartate aminotransferase
MESAARRIVVAAGHLLHGDSSVWASVEQAPADPILGVSEAFKADPSPLKLNLGVGAYCTEEGKPLVLNVVRKAEQRILTGPEGVDKEYLAIGGHPTFCKLARQLAFGSSSLPVSQDRVVTLQCISGTGSLRVGAEFIAAHYKGSRTVLIPDPTWGNHRAIFQAAGLQVRSYRYYQPATRGLNYEGLIEDLKEAEPGSVVLLHACAHNPTGVDPTQEQWQGIFEAITHRRLLPFFDSAYQGFASGDLDADAAALRMFAERGVELLLAQSFAKNMGLYGERVGALSLVVADAAAAKRVESQAKVIIRRMYSNPPRHGAAIAATVLGDPELFEEWKVELKAMADRIKAMRSELYGALQRVGAPGDWAHVLKQIGMFSFTGLTSRQVQHMTRNWHVYMTLDGRISMAGLSAAKAQYLAEAIADAVKNVK